MNIWETIEAFHVVRIINKKSDELARALHDLWPLVSVPQGSILDPILFLIFINNLLSTLQDTIAVIYADDTTISYSTDYKVAPQAVSDSLQSNLNNLQKWSDNNKMILNEQKTKVMLGTGKWLDKKLEQLQLQLKLNASELEQVNPQKLLGVTIDSKLSFDDHIDNLCSSVLLC